MPVNKYKQLGNNLSESFLFLVVSNQNHSLSPLLLLWLQNLSSILSSIIDVCGLSTATVSLTETLCFYTSTYFSTLKLLNFNKPLFIFILFLNKFSNSSSNNNWSRTSWTPSWINVSLFRLVNLLLSHFLSLNFISQQHKYSLDHSLSSPEHSSNTKVFFSPSSHSSPPPIFIH